MPTLGWDRAYRSGDLVRLDADGPGLRRAAPTTRSSSAAGGSSWARSTPRCRRCPASPAPRPPCSAPPAGNQVLVGYVAPSPTPGFDPPRPRPRRCASTLPAALVPAARRRRRRCPPAPRGKVDRDALPWPLPGARAGRRGAGSCAGDRAAGSPSSGPTSSGAAVDRARTTTSSTYGGGSLAAAQLVSPLRARLPGASPSPTSTTHPRLGALADDARRARRTGDRAPDRARSRPTPAATQVVPERCMASRCAPWSGCAGCYLARAREQRARRGSASSWRRRPCRGGGCWPAGCCSSPRSGGWRIAVVAARLLLRGVAARATTRAAGKVHLRLWLAEQLADGAGAANLAGAPWIRYYARALGATVGQDVDLHSLPPVTGLLTLGERLLDRARGRPRRLLARRRRAARRAGSRSAPTPRRLPQHPAPGRPGRRRRRGRAGLGRARRRCRPASAGPARRRARRRAPPAWPETAGAPRRRAGCSAYAPRPRRAGRLPAARGPGGRWPSSAWSLRGAGRPRRPRAGRGRWPCPPAALALVRG